MTNIIKQVVKLSGTYPVDVSSFDVTITPALTDITKAFHVINYRFDSDNNHAFTFRSSEIIDVNTLRIFGRGDLATGNVSMPFEATIFEFTANSSISVQRSSITRSGGEAEGEKTATISAVTLAQTSLIHHGHNFDAVETSIGVEEFERVRLITTTTWGALVGDTPNNGPHIVRVEIIDWGDSDFVVERGLFTMPDSATVSTDTPAGTPDRTRTMLTFSYSLEDTAPFSTEADQTMIQGEYTAGNLVQFERQDDSATPTSFDVLLAWELTEFPSYFAETQWASISMADGVGTATGAITDITSTSLAGVFSPSSGTFGHGTGECGTGELGGIGNGMATLVFNSSTEVEAQRVGTDDTFEITFQVIKFLKTTTLPFHTTNSLLNVVNTLTHDTDSLVVDKQQPFHTTDSVLKKLDTEITHTTDSVLNIVVTAIHTTDSLVKALDQTLIHTTDSVLKALDQLRIHTTDSALRRIDNLLTHTTDSILKAIQVLTHDTDSYLVTLTVVIQNHTTDSVLKAIQTLTHSTDSFLVLDPGIIGGDVEADLCVTERTTEDLCVDETTTEDLCVKEKSEVDLCA